MTLFLKPIRNAHLLPRTRALSTATSASSIASSFLSRFQSLGPQTRSQTLDANQLQLLTLTLNRPSLYPDTPSLSNNTTPPPAGTPLPPGYHLVYFTPAFQETELGADGTDVSYNPAAPFTRRMWAGGEVCWPRGEGGQVNPLRVGQEVTETTRVLSAEAKTVKKTGEEMIVVGVEKEFRNGEGVAVLDRRYAFFTITYVVYSGMCVNAELTMCYTEIGSSEKPSPSHQQHHQPQPHQPNHGHHPNPHPPLPRQPAPRTREPCAKPPSPSSASQP